LLAIERGTKRPIVEGSPRNDAPLDRYSSPDGCPRFSSPTSSFGLVHRKSSNFPWRNQPRSLRSIRKGPIDDATNCSIGGMDKRGTSHNPVEAQTNHRTQVDSPHRPKPRPI
jgi:hypothetical protein